MPGQQHVIDVTAAIERARFGRFQFLITALCALIALLDGFDTQAIAYVAPVIAEQWGMNVAGFGPIFGAGLAGLTVGAFILSPAADRFGRKSIILLSMLIFGVFSLVTAWAGTMNELLLYRFLTGVGLGGAMPNIIALSRLYTIWNVPNPSRSPSMKSRGVTFVTYVETKYALYTPTASASTTSVGSMIVAASSRGTTRNATGS